MTESPIFYITTDPMKALGIENIYPNYHIICVDYTPLVDILEQQGVSIFCYEKQADEINTLDRNTRKLLVQPEVQKYILDNSRDAVAIVMFKPNFNLQQVLKASDLAEKRTVTSLNNHPRLASKLEDKLNFHNLCVESNISIPPTVVQSLHSINYQNVANTLGEMFVIQFARGWFGNHTFFINSKDDLKVIKDKYTDRSVKISSYINGITLTNNAVIVGDKTLQTYPFLQITDQENSLARLPGSSVGNAWGELPVTNANEVVMEIKNYTEKIGSIINQQGYRGFFGLDFLVSDEGDVHVQELNARFTASAFLMAQMEKEHTGTSLLEQHFRAFDMEFFNEAEPEDLFIKLKGNRIVARHTDTTPIKITHDIPNGTYELKQDGSYTWITHYYRFEELEDTQFQLFTVADQREVTVDQELLQVQSKSFSSDKLQMIAKDFKGRLSLA